MIIRDENINSCNLHKKSYKLSYTGVIEKEGLGVRNSIISDYRYYLSGLEIYRIVFSSNKKKTKYQDILSHISRRGTPVSSWVPARENTEVVNDPRAEGDVSRRVYPSHYLTPLPYK